MDLHERTRQLKEKAKSLGFLNIGISKAEFMEEEAKRLEEWLNAGHHGSMSYMQNHFDLRTDPSRLVPGARSVISLSYNYYHPEVQNDTESPKISMYAYGRDYHKVIKAKLKELYVWMQANFGDISARLFTDSAPVLERDWAKRSGIGWTGKHTLLLHPKEGSYFFLSEVICDLEFIYDHPIKDHCGTCTRCIDACPTEAISPEGYVLEANKCISYLTIELKEDIPLEFKGKMENWMFGCDICQQVCPWNRFAKKHNEPSFEPSEQLLNTTKKEWIELSEEVFEELFKSSPVKRTKYQGLKRNIKFLHQNPTEQ